jgi:hypothetical protein
MSRAQRILQYVAGCTKPATLAEITAAVAIGEPRSNHSRASTVNVAAQLCQLYGDKKLARHGVLSTAPTRYTSTPITLSDMRKDRSRRQAAHAAQEARKHGAPSQGPLRRSLAVPRILAKGDAPQQQTLPQRLGPRQPQQAGTARPGERETVAEFEARGGRIQKLAHGESSQPAYVDVRAVDQRSMRKRLQNSARHRTRQHHRRRRRRRLTQELSMQDRLHGLTGPDFLDKVADAEAANGLDINAAVYRERSREWQRTSIAWPPSKPRRQRPPRPRARPPRTAGRLIRPPLPERAMNAQLI